MSAKKNKTISLDELSQMFGEEERRKEAVKLGKVESVDQLREVRMKEKRAKYPDGTLRAIIHPNKNGRRASLRWGTRISSDDS